jgi:hypothetical protein
VQDLLGRKLGEAEEVILAGSSAGKGELVTIVTTLSLFVHVASALMDLRKMYVNPAPL